MFSVVAYTAKKMQFLKVFFNAVAYSAYDFLALSPTALKNFKWKVFFLAQACFSWTRDAHIKI
jgi:hypothetical protein